MATEQERMERARQKLLSMNRKVQHAQSISKKRQPLRPLESVSPPPVAPPRPPTSTYIFELTESLLADGFGEDEVVDYVAHVEHDSKCSDIDLDQRELALQAEVKRINRAIGRIKDPKPPPTEPSESDIAPAQSGYADIRQARQKATASPQKPDTKVIAPKPQPERPVVKTTGAGAKFLADLADEDDNNIF
jgi:hypothetical protein